MSNKQSTIDVETDLNPEGLSWYEAINQPVAAYQMDGYVEAVTTRVLENCVQQLEQLRASLEKASLKEINDVREYFEMPAHNLIFGVEDSMNYNDLIVVIDSFKNGIAARRTSAL